MNAVVLRSYGIARLAATRRYLIEDARQLAIETNAGQSITTVIDAIRAHHERRPMTATYTQLALSLAPDERGSPDQLFAATRAVLGHPAVALDDRPWLAVLHGPPHERKLPHVHVLLPRANASGLAYPLASLPHALWTASGEIAPGFGWTGPRPDSGERRREPRQARSVGVWHGERSRYRWLADCVAPAILPAIVAATSWAEVRTLLADFGLRYVRTSRGGVLVDHSAVPPRGVPASALAFAVSAPRLEARLGPTPEFPVPKDAAINPRAYANDEQGRRLELGTDEERREFAAEHAAWRTIWAPVMAQRMRELRQRDRERRAEADEAAALLRAVCDAVAISPAEGALGRELVRSFRREKKRELAAITAEERRALRDLPFGRPPPSRLRAWLALRNAPPIDPRRLTGSGGSGAAVEILPEPLRAVAGIEPGTSEWWRGPRRVAVDCGSTIRICDETVLPTAIQVGAERWTAVGIGGDEPFRLAAMRLAHESGTAVRLLPRVVLREPDASPVIPRLRAIRVAAAIEEHLGEPLLLDGCAFERRRANEHPRAQAEEDASPPVIAPSRALAFAINDRVLARMRRDTLVPVLVADRHAVILLPSDVTAGERLQLCNRITRIYDVPSVPDFPAAIVEYGPRLVSPLIERSLGELRKSTHESTSEQRFVDVQWWPAAGPAPTPEMIRVPRGGTQPAISAGRARRRRR